jgi:serine/threonine-protein kinase
LTRPPNDPDTSKTRAREPGLIGVTPRICPTCLTPIPDDAAFCTQCGAPSATRILTPSTSGGVRTDLTSSSYAAEPEHLQRALGSNYELGRLIGRGGYAEVFAVRDRRLNRELAIKVLRPDLIVTKSLLARFRREAEAVAALHHRGIVPVYDVGQSDGIGFIVMPLIQGESLKRRLLAEPRLPVAEVKRILLEAADALAAAHAAGVVHRDIKPENIMLEGPERRVLLMDFGIAKAVDTADNQLTATGVIVGTPQYMSPEQACGDPNVDHRSDQYSLAVVGYQMLSGRVPFEGETARAVMAKQMLDEPPPLWELVAPLPTAMMAALERALAKDPGKRFPTIGEFAAALRQESGLVRPDKEKARRARSRATRRGRPWALWATGALSVALTVVAVSQWRPPAPPATPAKPETTFVARQAASPPPPPAPAPPLKGNDRADRVVTVVDSLPAPGPAREQPAASPRVDSVVVAPAPAPPPPPTCAGAFLKDDWATAYALCPAEAKQSAVASRYAGVLFAEGRGGPEDPDQALALLQDAVARGDAPARALLSLQQYQVARRLERTDPSRATELYRSAALAGVEKAFPILAERFEKGIGTPRDLGQAADWYERAAQGGHVPSELRLAQWYARGFGVAKDEARAARWFREAAQQGNPEAMYQYGMALLNGRGVTRSEQDGISWIGQAAAAGNQEAARELERRR